MGKYSNAEALFLNEGIFDHSLGVLTFHPETSNGKKPFKYFRMWSYYPTYEEKVKEVWTQQVYGTRMYQVVTKLKAMKGVLKEINKQGFSELHVARAKAKEVLAVCQNKLQMEPQNLLLHQEELEARHQFLKVHSDLLSMLQQKAKVSWDGTRTDQPEQVTDAFLSYYKMLLGSSMENRKKVIRSVVNVGPKVTNQQAEMLMEKYSKEECKAALFAIPGIKAPGPDGYSSYFFQDNWELIGNELYEVVESFLSSGKFLKEINSTVLTLIPKVKCPNTVKDFRGLRQGDPMSPLLFVLGMEYLSRIMQRIGSKEEFRFHERCEGIKLNHLSFADDVLLFSKGDFKSVYLMLQGLKLFSLSSSLHPNPTKPAVYFSGMHDKEIQ
ncbi:uncharacterized protein LOC133037066 [Cannabis sativa]|uniref:uncharacterized protein LOC133037066 n=1 Tax=Cannabis sativa TaxID=3483 RepID=UPI0029CA4770|nr:uncharacterized protein LOC133037066 [Cannabis sativa]